MRRSLPHPHDSRLMVQFDVYPNPVESLRETHPWVVEIQSNLLKRPVALIGIPLAYLEHSTTGVDHARRFCVGEQGDPAAIPPPALRSPRHAALRLLAHWSALRRCALPSSPITALTGASHCRF